MGFCGQRQPLESRGSLPSCCGPQASQGCQVVSSKLPGGNSVHEPTPGLGRVSLPQFYNLLESPKNHVWGAEALPPLVGSSGPQGAWHALIACPGVPCRAVLQEGAGG